MIYIVQYWKRSVTSIVQGKNGHGVIALIRLGRSFVLTLTSFWFCQLFVLWSMKTLCTCLSIRIFRCLGFRHHLSNVLTQRLHEEMATGFWISTLRWLLLGEGFLDLAFWRFLSESLIHSAYISLLVFVHLSLELGAFLSVCRHPFDVISDPVTKFGLGVQSWLGWSILIIFINL